jgi:DNA-binding MarR family transcriptional regulator
MPTLSHQSRILTALARTLLTLSESPQISQTALAAWLAASRRHVVRHIDALEAAGYISVDRSSMHRTSCVYTVVLDEDELAALRLLVAREDAQQEAHSLPSK